MYHRKEKHVTGLLGTEPVENRLGILDGKKNWSGILLCHHANLPVVERGMCQVRFQYEVGTMASAPEERPELGQWVSNDLNSEYHLRTFDVGSKSSREHGMRRAMT